MNEKKGSLCFIIICFFIALACGIAGYCAGRSSGLAEVTRLAAEYDAATRDRDATFVRITENNQRLRDGAERAQARLWEAETRVGRLEEYIRSAEIRNQSIIAAVGESRQNLAEAIGIIGGYLNQEQTTESNSDGGNPGGGRSGDNSRLGAE